MQTDLQWEYHTLLHAMMFPYRFFVRFCSFFAASHEADWPSKKLWRDRERVTTQPTEAEGNPRNIPIYSNSHHVWQHRHHTVMCTETHIIFITEQLQKHQAVSAGETKTEIVLHLAQKLNWYDCGFRNRRHCLPATSKLMTARHVWVSGCGGGIF